MAEKRYRIWSFDHNGWWRPDALGEKGEGQ